MKPTKISECGTINDNGRLLMPMDRLNAFFLANRGQRVIVRFETAEPGSSKLQQAYYYNYVLPTIVQALREQGTRISEERADSWLIDQYPGGFYYDGNKQNVGRQLTQPQMSEFLEWLKQYAAENLYVYIEDPKTL